MPLLLVLSLGAKYALKYLSVSLQQLSNENRQQAKRNAGREDMKWQVNVEVHDPEIGLVSAVLHYAWDYPLACFAPGVLCLLVLVVTLLYKRVSYYICDSIPYWACQVSTLPVQVKVATATLVL